MNMRFILCAAYFIFENAKLTYGNGGLFDAEIKVIFW